jgi:hypothetical protein
MPVRTKEAAMRSATIPHPGWTKLAAGSGLLLAVLATGACSTMERIGWTGNRAEATAEARAECDAATATIRGGPDHRTAMRACLDAKRRRPNGPRDPDHGATRPAVTR